MKKIIQILLCVFLTGCSKTSLKNTFINSDDIRKFFDLQPALRFQYDGKYTLDFETEAEYEDYIQKHMNTSQSSHIKIIRQDDAYKVIGLTEVNDIFLSQQYFIGIKKDLPYCVSQCLDDQIDAKDFLTALNQKVYDGHGIERYQKIVAELEQTVLKESYFVIKKILKTSEYEDIDSNITMYYVLHFTYEVDKNIENNIRNVKLMNDCYFQSEDKNNKISIEESTGISLLLEGSNIYIDQLLQFEDLDSIIHVKIKIETI